MTSICKQMLTNVDKCWVFSLSKHASNFMHNLTNVEVLNTITRGEIPAWGLAFHMLFRRPDAQGGLKRHVEMVLKVYKAM